MAYTKKGAYMDIGNIIAKKRKAAGLTQKGLAEKLNISFQAVSKWEQGAANPEIDLLPSLAQILGTTVDALVGYRSPILADYEARYEEDGYYWGIEPNRFCYEIMRRMPPVKPIRVLDIGCGEGKDAVFLARNGYQVSAFDITDSGIEKGKMLAEKCGTYVDFFKADIRDFRPTKNYDVIFCSGVFHFVPPDLRPEIMESLKKHTNKNGLHTMNVFIHKPFVEEGAGKDKERYYWKSGEMFTYYTDWLIHKMDEEIFDCNSGGIPHKHCMDLMIAEKIIH